MADDGQLDPISEFGRSLMVKVRDRGIDHLDGALASEWKAASLRKLRRELKTLEPEQRAPVRRAFVSSFDAAIHGFLAAIQEQNDSDERVAVLVDGCRVADESDGLNGELFNEDAWSARFSNHGEPAREA